MEDILTPPSSMRRTVIVIQAHKVFVGASFCFMCFSFGRHDDPQYQVVDSELEVCCIFSRLRSAGWRYAGNVGRVF